MNYIENNTWVRGNTRFISSVAKKLQAIILFKIKYLS